MSTTPKPQPRPVELDDVQGLVRTAYKHLTQASYLVLRVKNPAAAKAWLAQVPVTNGIEAFAQPKRALQIALSYEGLRALGIAEDILQGFSGEFVAGMAGDDNRSRRLGDVGESDPTRWAWGFGKKPAHVLVMLYAEPGALVAWQQEILRECSKGFEKLAVLDTSDMDGREPFGFVDGISQPKLDWQRQRPVEDRELRDYTNLSCLGEFLLGYPNEYGLYTDRPLLEAGDPAAHALPRAEDAPDKADLGRNGSYLVMRQLDQDVAGFWQSLDQQANGDADLRRRWAETMVGRTLDGTPLVAPEGDPKEFDYRSDPKGLRCPIGAHIRRANPRNADLPPGKPGFFGWLWRTLGFDRRAREQDLIASTRFHRLLRRGREYGTELSLDQALSAPVGKAKAGLHFICLNANIARQFEFVQAAWLMGTRFGGLDSEGDPLLGSRQPAPDGKATDGFSIPQDMGPNLKLCGLPRFVTVRGGAYFFLPGLRALRYLATAS